MSDNNTAAGCLAAFLWIGAIALSIGSGILAWNWIDPDSFLGGIKFLIVWGILSWIGYLVIAGIIALIGSWSSSNNN